MQADTIQAADWWARSRGPTHQAWITNYQQSTTSRHRDVIAAIVRELQPETLLEVGCHCVPNLIRLAAELPQLEMLGLDANTEAIQAGRQWVEARGYRDRIQLNVGRVPDQTVSLPSGAVDVVLSCYTLAYIAPPDLDMVLYDLGRLATRAVILAEPMTDAAESQWPASFGGYQEWVHNYRARVPWLNSWSGMILDSFAIDPPVDRLACVVLGLRV